MRIGGAIGTALQLVDCPASNSVTNNCIAGSMMFHMTSTGSDYLENIWLWAADHDIDDPKSTNISVFVARGMLIESHGPVWLYGTASEHAVLYQYEFYNAGNVFATMIQTESVSVSHFPNLASPHKLTLTVPFSLIINLPRHHPRHLRTQSESSMETL